MELVEPAKQWLKRQQASTFMLPPSIVKVTQRDNVTVKDDTVRLFFATVKAISPGTRPVSGGGSRIADAGACYGQQRTGKTGFGPNFVPKMKKALIFNKIRALIWRREGLFGPLALTPSGPSSRCSDVPQPAMQASVEPARILFTLPIGQ